MKNSLLNYQTNLYLHQLDKTTTNCNDTLFFNLFQQSEYNLDTILKMIYMQKIDKVSKSYKYHLVFSDEFRSTNFKINYERFRISILNITPGDVATVLKQIRIQSGFSLEQLSRLTGFSKSSISHRESFKTLTFPNLKTIQKYLDSCNLTFFQFIYLIVLKGLIE